MTFCMRDSSRKETMKIIAGAVAALAMTGLLFTLAYSLLIMP